MPLGGLTPSDFHQHWYWERDYKSIIYPLLNLVYAGRQYNRDAQQIAPTGRILSAGKAAPARQAPTCSACSNQGHTRTSRECPLK